MRKETQKVVQIADMKMTKTHGELITYALGSCIGISLYDRKTKLTALIHIMLPEHHKAVEKANVFKFADTAITETLRKMQMLGTNKENISCTIAGGASMFNTRPNSRLSYIGENNIKAVIKKLGEEEIHITNSEVGGKVARTMSVNARTGTVTIREVGGQKREF